VEILDYHISNPEVLVITVMKRDLSCKAHAKLYPGAGYSVPEASNPPSPNSTVSPSYILYNAYPPRLKHLTHVHSVVQPAVPADTQLW
jgi:hypothetical protein